MCLPLAIIGAVVSVAGTAASIIQQSKAANAQAKAIANQKAVADEEARKAATGEMFEQMRAARREQAKIRTAAGEAGLSLSGGSIESLLQDSAMQMELQGSRTLANLESRTASNDAQAGSMMSRIEAPNALTAGLQLASAGTKAWSSIGNAKITKSAASKV